MNIVTQGLASLALARAVWPRAPKRMWIAAVGAGMIADVDYASAWWSAPAYFRWHRTYTHSVLAAVIFAAVLAMAYQFIAASALRERFSVRDFFSMTLAAECLHLALDVCGSQGAALLWPFTARRFALDWAVELDPCIVAVLLGALLLPELAHLVTSEIGARDTRPRGRVSAIVGFVLIFLYLGVRANFHGNVVVLLGSRTFHGEVTDRVAAFPATFSPFEWYGVVDTARGVHTLTVAEGPVESFDPESAETQFKPEPSPALDAAQQTATARRFLMAARFPKATVDKEPTETAIILRDLSAELSGETDHEVIAVILLNSDGRVLSERLAWANRRDKE